MDRDRVFFVSVLLPILLCGATLAQAPTSPAPDKQARDPFAVVAAARQDGRFRMLLRQFRAEEPTLQDRHEAGRRDAMPKYQDARDLPAAHWVWVRPYWFLFRDGPDETREIRAWDAEQACGAPDTPEAGDKSTAWATREPDAAGREWLLLEYGSPVRATAVELHESFNPGAVCAIAILTPQGDELEVWRAASVQPSKDALREQRIDLPLGFAVERLKLYLQSDAVPGWNEIDAVGLTDVKGKVHWAVHAEASSTYAEVVAAAGNGIVVAPRGVQQQQFWVRVQQPNVPLLVQPVQIQPLQLQPLRIQAQVQQQPVQLAPAAPLSLLEKRWRRSVDVVPTPPVQPGQMLEPGLHHLGETTRGMTQEPAETPAAEAMTPAPAPANDAAARQARIAEIERKIAELQAELARLRNQGK